ncbi:MAG: HAMP domain-containing sensor histidine kinase, partial [Anaerolineae bacterium]
MKAFLRWFRSLQAQLILWAILPVTLVLIALAFTGIYAHQQEMQDFVSERNVVVTQLLAQRLEDGLVHGVVVPGGEGLKAWLSQESAGLPGTVLVVDTLTDQVLARTDSQMPGGEAVSTPVQQILASESETMIVNDASGGPVLVTSAPVRGTSWHVIIREPVEGLIGPILRFSSLGPIVALVAAGLSVVILTFGWRTIVAPLRKLSQAAEQVSWGDHVAIEQPITGVSEIRDLHRTLREMVARVEAYEASVRDYVEALTRGQEAERARLARELHDGPVQTLIALGQRLEMARRQVERGQREVVIEQLEALREAEVSLVEDLRRIIGALRPIYLEDLGFLPALEALVRAADQRTEAQIHLEPNADLQRFCPTVELAAYRVTQEALNNAVQHARADTITVRVSVDAGDLILTVVDDGMGFELAERLDSYTQAGHFGLVGLQER